ncbi:hypothetical protein PVAP13_3KG370600 [Panicum virgatum]|uniref:Uncharacterized protein n=1 Tax=Panicum virgatum TaxID=38727 RepID=A0A8T0UX10_PANVG|nr:hypothetical protein PVAP13_3KG370600 [Panicum virgatum]
MGNCACRAPRSRHGAEDGGGGGEPAWAERRESGGEERKRAGVEVTVRISKRRLRRLMAEAAVGGGMTVEKVLAEIVSAGGEAVAHGRRRRRWEPALQSIPEACES